MSTYADRLNQAMKEEKINHSELARRIGVKPQAIQYLCSDKGSKNKRSRYTSEIADALRVRADWLANNNGPMRHSSDVRQPPILIRDIEAAWPHLPKSIQHAIHALVMYSGGQEPPPARSLPVRRKPREATRNEPGTSRGTGTKRLR